MQQTTGNILLKEDCRRQGAANVYSIHGVRPSRTSPFPSIPSVSPICAFVWALLYGIDRQTILDGLVHGYNEIIERIPVQRFSLI